MGFSKSTGQIILLILLAIISYSLLHENNLPIISKPDSQKNLEKPSAIITNGQYRFYDKNGRVSNLSSKEALYFLNSDQIQVQSPSLFFDTSEGRKISVKAQNGSFHSNNETLSLTGGVIVQQITEHASVPADTSDEVSEERTELNDTWTLRSDEFEINKKTLFISTSQAVTITKGQTLIRAIGLNAWINEKKIELLSEVRGQHVFN